MTAPRSVRRDPVSADEATRRCESPIEAAFLEAFSQLCCMNAAERAGPDEDPVMIRPQARIGDYRVDFLISQGDTELIVECDGHDFHERTQEQAASDRSRDRYLQACNYVVFRFTGQEIFRDVEGCAKEVCEFIDKRAKEPVTPRAMTDAPALLTIHPFPSRSRA